jgi:hypothetical protein
MNTLNLTKANGLDFGHISWRYYNKIKKKAMEREFSWSGLALSLSIAFFIVIISAFCLSILYNSYTSAKAGSETWLMKLYQQQPVNYTTKKNWPTYEIGGQKFIRVEKLNLA